MVSRLSSLVIGTPRASAASFIQFDKQLRQKPARFIKSMFCTSVRARKCSTRRRNAAASSSVRVLSSSAIAGSFQLRSKVHLRVIKNRDAADRFPAHVASEERTNSAYAATHSAILQAVTTDQLRRGGGEISAHRGHPAAREFES